MKRSVYLISIVMITLISNSFKNMDEPNEIIQMTIDNIDTIVTIYYKQDMVRTNPRNVKETISRYREMYFKKLAQDSIVGVKGHWYMYVDNKVNIIYEDIYDGNILIRKNNRDSTARIFDLDKHPEFRNTYFWGHNTPYSMQYMLRCILKNKEYYQIKRLNDTIFQNTDCFQILIRIEDKESMPGYAYKLQNKEGSVSITQMFIDKMSYYPIHMRMENYSKDNPEQIFFTDQTYYDLKFNIKLDTIKEFSTSNEILAGYEITEIKP